MERCPLCKDADLATEAERAYQICAACAALLGAEDIPDPRPRVPCRGCGHMELLRANTTERLVLSRPEVTMGREYGFHGDYR